MKFIILTVLSSFIVSCSTLSKEECQVINWLEIGKSDGLEGKETHTFSTHPNSKACIKYDVTIQDQYEKGHTQGIKLFCTEKNWFETGKSDGLKGRGAEAFSWYHKRCAEYNIKVHKNKYEEGRVQGIKLFCTYNKGHALGLSGKEYLNTCPKELEVDFLKGYQIGKKAYNQQERKKQQQWLIEQARQQQRQEQQMLMEEQLQQQRLMERQRRQQRRQRRWFREQQRQQERQQERFMEQQRQQQRQQERLMEQQRQQQRQQERFMEQQRQQQRQQERQQRQQQRFMEQQWKHNSTQW